MSIARHIFRSLTEGHLCMTYNSRLNHLDKSYNFGCRTYTHLKYHLQSIHRYNFQHICWSIYPDREMSYISDNRISWDHHIPGNFHDTSSTSSSCYFQWTQGCIKQRIPHFLNNLSYSNRINIIFQKVHYR